MVEAAGRHFGGRWGEAETVGDMAGTGQGSVEEDADRSGCIAPLLALVLLGTVLVLLRFGGATLAFALLGRPVGVVALVGIILAIFFYARRGARRRR